MGQVGSNVELLHAEGLCDLVALTTQAFALAAQHGIDQRWTKTV